MNRTPKVSPMVDQRVRTISNITQSISVSHLKANESRTISFVGLSAMQVSSDPQKYFHSRRPTWITRRSVEQEWTNGKCPYCIYARDDLNVPITLCLYRPRCVICKGIRIHAQAYWANLGACIDHFQVIRMRIREYFNTPWRLGACIE